MSAATVAAYVMNPAEDVVLYGSDLAGGMLVLPEIRRNSGTEDEQIREQRFRRVTRLRPAAEPGSLRFIGEWVDGYQQGDASSAGQCWIVKRDSIPAPGDAA
jgi:hypothetical protein